MKRNMLQTPITLLFATACLSLASAPTVQAGPVTSNVATEAWTPFAKGNTELELLVGAYGGLSSTDTAISRTRATVTAIGATMAWAAASDCPGFIEKPLGVAAQRHLATVRLIKALGGGW